MTAVMERDDVEPVANERLDRFLTGTATVVPFVAVGAAAVLTWQSLLHWSDVIIFVILYVLTGLGITVGFHRHLTHRAFKAKKWVRAMFAAFGSMAIEGPVISWVADHRKHHAFTDVPGDPHSPHVDHGHGWQGRAARPRARPPRLAVPAHGARQEGPLRPRPDRRPDDQLHRPHLPDVGHHRARHAVRARRRDRRLARHRADRDPVGRPRARVPAAPRDLLDQLAVPLLRPQELRHGRRVAQPAVARAAVVRRVVAQQPPRLPDLRPPRPQALGDRHLGRRDLGAGEARAWCGTSCASRPSARRARRSHPPRL